MVAGASGTWWAVAGGGGRCRAAGERVVDGRLLTCGWLQKRPAWAGFEGATGWRTSGPLYVRHGRGCTWRAPFLFAKG